ncbi:MAG: acyl carrier protein [Planctomycetota bacterium]
MSGLSRDEITARVRDALVETFELPPEEVTLEARLYEDLDLDSIDAIDLVVKLEVSTGLKLEEDDVKQIRTVADIVDTVDRKLNATAGDRASEGAQEATPCESSSP